jgi:LETM1 and EF-hand domain-containing protein 1, mitochondrial
VTTSANPTASSKNEATAEPKTKETEGQSSAELVAEKSGGRNLEEKNATDEKGKEEKKKLTLTQRIKKELVHYWDGTKLLATEVKISSKLALKMAAGYELTRRENRQVGDKFLHFFFAMIVGTERRI